MHVYGCRGRQFRTQCTKAEISEYKLERRQPTDKQ